MTNVLKVNPATSGLKDSTAINRVAAVLHDSSGNDLGSGNPIFVSDSVYNTVVDSASTPTIYYGFALPGTATSSASWRILRKTVSGTTTSYEYAGDGSFSYVFDDRASLSY